MDHERRESKLIIAVDFDDTLCYNGFPDISKGFPNGHLILKLRKLQERGADIILFTCRKDKSLEEAVDFCTKNDLRFDAVNSNTPEMISKGFDSVKPYADIYIDDRSIDPIVFESLGLDEIMDLKTPLM